MANNYFRFKEFTVNQEKCAMKVCTDACLFGAWAADKFSPEKVLDIGTGTGLLSLMLAQKNNAVIDAVEIDADASIEAGANFNASPWKERLHIFHSSIQEFHRDKYDMIISNPPFFKNDLKSPDAARNVALHSEALSLDELLISVNRLLTEDGKFVVLLPFHRAGYFEELTGQYKLFMREKLVVKQTPGHDPFRVCYQISKSKEDLKETFIIIKDINDQYTDQFKNLLKDYYLQ
jgi:tRNA1Val (adenine37-N6)-methyltransferase